MLKFKKTELYSGKKIEILDIYKLVIAYNKIKTKFVQIKK